MREEQLEANIQFYKFFAKLKWQNGFLQALKKVHIEIDI